MFSQDNIEVFRVNKNWSVYLEDNSHLNASGFDKINTLVSLPVVIFFFLYLTLPQGKVSLDRVIY